MARRQKRRTVKKGSNRKLLYGVVLVTIVLLAVLVVYYIFFMPYIENWTAAIIDQLAIEGEKYINIEFNTTITSLLNVSGFDVKYYPGEDVNLDFYEDLPSKGSKIVVLRAHSAVRNERDFVDLFSSESYDPQKEDKYSSYGEQISIAKFLGTDNKYFAVGPTFVDWSMKGRFDSNCVIILMGCNGLNETSMAEALVRRGARVVIGWIGWVEVNDTDSSTKQLLQYLLDENPYPIYGAVDKVNQQPHQNSVELDYFPKDEKTKYYTIPKRKNQTLTCMIWEPFCSLTLIIAPEWKPVKTDGLGERVTYSST